MSPTINRLVLRGTSTSPTQIQPPKFIPSPDKHHASLPSLNIENLMNPESSPPLQDSPIIKLEPPSSSTNIHAPADVPGFPTFAHYKHIESTYLSTLSPRKVEKALLSQDMFDTIWDVLHTTPGRAVTGAIGTAQFRFWVRKMFSLRKIESGATVVLHEDRIVAIKEQMYELLCFAHDECQHSGRDKTCAAIREHYTWVPKELVAQFVRACPTCITKRGVGRSVSSDAADVRKKGKSASPRVPDGFNRSNSAPLPTPPILAVRSVANDSWAYHNPAFVPMCDIQGLSGPGVSSRINRPAARSLAIDLPPPVFRNMSAPLNSAYSSASSALTTPSLEGSRPASALSRPESSLSFASTMATPGSDAGSFDLEIDYKNVPMPPIVQRCYASMGWDHSDSRNAYTYSQIPQEDGAYPVNNHRDDSESPLLGPPSALARSYSDMTNDTSAAKTQKTLTNYEIQSNFAIDPRLLTNDESNYPNYSPVATVANTLGLGDAYKKRVMENSPDPMAIDTQECTAPPPSPLLTADHKYKETGIDIEPLDRDVKTKVHLRSSSTASLSESAKADPYDSDKNDKTVTIVRAHANAQESKKKIQAQLAAATSTLEMYLELDGAGEESTSDQTQQTWRLRVFFLYTISVNY